MVDNHRQFRRMEKPLSVRFCISGVSLQIWDMSVIENISVGGIKFTASGRLNLKDKIILLQIAIPQLAPRTIELEAVVLDVKPHMGTKFFDVRAEFINLSDKNREYLSVIEKILDKKI